MAKWPRSVRLVRICIRPIGSMPDVAWTNVVSQAAFLASWKTDTKKIYKRWVQQISHGKKRKNKSITSKTLLSECILNKESFNLAYKAEKKFCSNPIDKNAKCRNWQANLKNSNKFQKNEFTICKRILKLDFKALQTGLFRMTQNATMHLTREQ